MIKNIERFTNHFLLQNVLILGLFFSFYKKAATSYLWGFFTPLHALQKWKIYVLHTADLLPIFMTWRIIVDKKGVITDSFLVFHIFFFFGKGDYDGVGGRGVEMRERLI